MKQFSDFVNFRNEILDFLKDTNFQLTHMCVHLDENLEAREVSIGFSIDKEYKDITIGEYNSLKELYSYISNIYVNKNLLFISLITAKSKNDCNIHRIDENKEIPSQSINDFEFYFSFDLIFENNRIKYSYCNLVDKNKNINYETKKQINLYIDGLSKISDKDFSSLKYTISDKNEDLQDLHLFVQNFGDFFQKEFDYRVNFSNDFSDRNEIFNINKYFIPFFDNEEHANFNISVSNGKINSYYYDENDIVFVNHKNNKIGYIKSGKEYVKNINELIQRLNFLIF